MNQNKPASELRLALGELSPYFWRGAWFARGAWIACVPSCGRQ